MATDYTAIFDLLKSVSDQIRVLFNVSSSSSAAIYYDMMATTYTLNNTDATGYSEMVQQRIPLVPTVPPESPVGTRGAPPPPPVIDEEASKETVKRSWGRKQ